MPWQALTKRADILAAIRLWEEKFAIGAEQRRKYNGIIYYHSDQGIWGGFREPAPGHSNRYWNPFGRSSGGRIDKICVQINPPDQDFDPNIQGLIAKDADGARWALHKGSLHMSGKNITNEMFRDAAKIKSVKVHSPEGDALGYFPAVNIDGSPENVKAQMAAFIQECSRVRTYWSGELLRPKPEMEKNKVHAPKGSSSAFLLTWKQTGWPYSNIKKMLERFAISGHVDEAWRLRSHRKAQIGDRVWLIRQGSGPKNIFGMGQITKAPYKTKTGTWSVGVKFTCFADPKVAHLIEEQALKSVLTGKQIAAQASGDPITHEQDQQLISLSFDSVVARARNGQSGNPDWARDELVLALDIYLQHRESLPPKNGTVVTELSAMLQQLGSLLFSPSLRTETFRNEAGVYMKLANFRRLDPLHTSQGKIGLSRGAKGEEAVWAEFAEDPARCHSTALAIRSNIESGTTDTDRSEDIDDGFVDAPEGRVLTKSHLSRERSRTLVVKKIKQAKSKYGTLNCEVCTFNFMERYGSRGEDVIECHHKRPVSELKPGQRTNLAELALICANCHRIIHRKKPWLTVEELRFLLDASNVGNKIQRIARGA